MKHQFGLTRLVYAGLFCWILTATLPSLASEPNRLFDFADQVTVFRRPGRNVFFFTHRPRIFWLDVSSHSVFGATSHPTFPQWLYNLLRPKTHRREPWAHAHPYKVFGNNDLVSFTIGQTGDFFFLSPAGIAAYSPRMKLLYQVKHQFSDPTSIAVSSQCMYIADRGTSKLYVLSPPAITILQAQRTRGDTQLSGSFAQSVLQEFTPNHGLIPDKLLISGSSLYGMNYSHSTLIRYSLATDSGQNSSGKSIASGRCNGLIGPTADGLVLPTLKGVEDFAIVDDSAFILEPVSSSIAAVSFHGGGLHYLNIDGLLGDVRTTAATPNSLVFSDVTTGNFKVFQRIVPATLYTEGVSIPFDIGTYYQYLYRRKLLPYITLSIESREKLNDALNARYLSSPRGFEVFCLLNGVNSLNCADTLPVPGRVVFPDLTFQSDQTTETVRLLDAPIPGGSQQPQTAIPSPIHLGDIVRLKMPGETDATLRQLLLSDNLDYKGKDILQEQRGSFDIPVRTVQANAFISSSADRLSYKLRRDLSKDSLLTTPIGTKTQSVRVQPDSANLSPAYKRLRASNSPSNTATDKPLWRKTINCCSTPFLSKVGVVDFSFDCNHPLFKPKQLTPYSQSNDVIPTCEHSGSKPTGPEQQPKNDIDIIDHGTYMSGLIAGQSVKGISYGVNPEATLFGVRVDDFINAVRYNTYPIYNLSLGEPDILAGSKLDAFKTIKLPNPQDWINTIPKHRRSLFVISAGNTNSDKLTGRLAGLGNNENVITVMASNTSGLSVWTVDKHIGSNHNYPIVSLAAPGEQMEGGTYDDAWAYASGTSQATALVTGAASLLHGRYGFLPWKIKQRIIATTNVDVWIKQFKDDSLGGVLDVDRAYKDADKTVMTFKVGKPSTETQPGVTCVGSFTGQEAKRELRIDGVNSNKAIRVGDIRRLHWDDLEHEFTIWYAAVPSNASSDPEADPTELLRASFALEQLQDPDFGPDNGKFSITFESTDDCAVVPRKISNVAEWFGGFYD